MECNLRPCEVRGRKAFFHGFFIHSRVIPPSIIVGEHSGGVVSYPLAIVEYLDGTVTECGPSVITFTDRDETK